MTQEMSRQQLAAPESWANFIDGRWAEAADGRTFERRDPFDQTLAGTYADSSEVDVERATVAARAAFDSGPWPRMSASERAAVLGRAAKLLRERATSIASMMTREVGQPGQLGAVAEAADHLEYFAGLAVSRRDEAVTGQHADAIGLVAKEPVGVVGALTSWNVPLSPAYKSCPGVAVGCSVVVKPGHQASGGTLELARALHDAGLPDGVFNVVTGAADNGAVAGRALAGSPRVDMVTFTGSSATGRAVMRAASDNLSKVSLELGGKSPHVVFADVPSIDRAAAAAAKGFVRLAGQSCQAGSRLLLHEDIKAEFLERLLEHVAQTRIGDPFDSKTTCGPLVSAEQLERVSAHAESGKRTSRLLVGGERPDEDDLASGFFFQPTVFDEVPADAQIAQEEIFGPVLAVLSFRDVDEAIALSNRTAYGLAAGCWSADLSTAMRFARGVRAGIVWINGFRDDSVLKQMPMGGYKQSGIGRERGPEGMEAFLETKSVMIKSV
ncbi:aldehyde dehydrogenase family protein [Saccharomonospora sp. NPDC046836]|uniref:aldehyde dehydrogenase family protein n=1 Tax=Saccharomonospora sp. NPDC046836 TaxID=3156921 RepID=UPI0033C14B1C